MDVTNIIIPQGRLAINLAYGQKLINDYLFELDQVSNGVPYAELGIGERRAASLPKMVETPNDKKPFKNDRIVVVTLNGMIKADDGWSSYGTRTVGEKLIEAGRDKDVIGALFKINSGGGYMDGAEAMIAAMREFGKPIITLASYAGSAAYMIASESTQINAETDFSEFGSIGVYIDLNKQFKDLYKQYVETAYSENSPNKNKAFRDWLENDDLSGFVKQATEADDMFMGLIKKNRKLTASTKEETLSGGMFYAKDAQARGLIDGISNNAKSISTLQKLSRI